MSRHYMTGLLDRLVPKEGLILMVMAVIVGTGTGLAAVFFIKLIAIIQGYSYTTIAGLYPPLGRLWLVLIPVLGALIGGPIIAYFAMEAKGHGVPEVMQALVLHSGRIRPRVAAAKIFASALCIGSGGSAGREGPIVQVGATLGSSIGQWLHLSGNRIKNLVACGAAAGIAATFNAPIAGVAFSAELLMTEHGVAMFGNVVISAVCSSIISRIFLGASPAFNIPSYSMHSPWEIPLYVILGLLSALIGVMFIKMLDTFEELFDHWKVSQAIKPAVGALLLGILGFLYPYLCRVLPVSAKNFHLGLPLINNMPHIYCTGFPFMELALQGSPSFWLLAVLIILKPLATSFTLGSGNSGGIFSPSLFTGAMLGGAFGHIVKAVFPAITGPVGAYALVGMAAVFAAAARAPLTSILIVFEMSGDYHLILPLMTATIIGSSVAQWIFPDSIYTLKLTKRGIHFDQGRDLDIMQGVLVKEVMNCAPITVQKDQSLSELFALFHETHLYGFPVMENDEDLYGMVTLQDMEQALSKEGVKIRDLKIGDVATPNPVTVFPDEPTWAAIRKMAPRDLARLPVVSRDNKRKLVGLISLSDILRAYDIGLLRKQQGQYARERMALRNVSGIEFTEVTVQPDSACRDKRLVDIKLPQNTTVVSIERKDGSVIIPDGDTVIMPGDQVTILCQSNMIKDVQKRFSPPSKPSDSSA
ncbi:MAG: CBS domain-containing protein [Nitrospiraceae bacterium]|nr:CBS domain-containing protein [Nitrospiraceae bacterium]